jgi:hypothetical protein
MELKSALSPPASWLSDLLSQDDDRSIALAVVSCAGLMLPYWDMHNPRDDRMECVVSALSEWARNPTSEGRAHILNSLSRVAVERRGFLSPIEPVPVGSDCPGDYAGDSIIAAANAIGELGNANFRGRAEDCLRYAAEAVSQMMGHRQPEDERTDFWSLALESIRTGIIEQLRTITT